MKVINIRSETVETNSGLEIWFVKYQIGLRRQGKEMNMNISSRIQSMKTEYLLGTLIFWERSIEWMNKQ